MYLSVGGRTIDREIQIIKDEEVNITCHAIGALPAANLSWRINEKLVNFPSTYSSLKNKEGTFDAVSTIQFRPEPEHKEVDCVSTFNGSDKEQVVHGTLLVKDKPKLQNFPLLWAIVSSFLASLLITLNCFYCLRRKFKGKFKSFL
ncbi:hypothetical protein HOLleu_36379 [Holothuria leucospilota]|uniref:CD80-like immunoglobulin C2-set domain-containing protein n=1 Tax=Holothuria leucospilota TaxID=206669 RepID=A0A9Q0YJP4_HOLLE|nr:hypothetical protein HOLleu_36379 [Holothuria leucospilota]